MTSTDTVVDLLRDGLHCGPAQCSGPLTLVPLFHRGATASYRLLAAAFAAGWVTVEEAGAGSVSELVVANRGSDAVLLLEGEILGGLRQTRTLNATVLVPPCSRLTIPVSCVEAGRWGAAQPTARGEYHTSPRLREAKNRGVGRMARAGGGYHSDQALVWREVESRLAAHRVASPTACYADLARGLSGQVDRVTGPLRPQAGQQGVLALAAGRALAMDLFDRPQTLAAMWHGLVGAYAADALVAGAGTTVGGAAAEDLAALAAGEATRHEGVGLGEVVFLTSAAAVVSALVVGGAVVHLAALWAAGEAPTEAAGRRSWFGEGR